MNKNLAIDKHQLSSILTDFQILLDFIGSDGELVSKKQLVFSASTLLELNLLMTKPINHKKTRPQLTTFPHIAIVYKCAHLLRFFHFTDKGARKQINLNPAALESWKKLNPVEQYFTLLAKWLYGDKEDSLDFLAPINRIARFRQDWIDRRRFSFQEILKKEYKISIFLAGIELFGFADITHGKPDSDGNWKITSIKQTEMGKFAFEIILKELLSLNDNFLATLFMEKETNKKNLFDVFRPYYPDLKNNFQLQTEAQNRTGVHIFKVSLHRSWRRIAVTHSTTLEELADLILQAFNFENDHLHNFEFIDISGHKREYSHPDNRGDEHFTDEVTLSKLPLNINGSMKFIFDFGDWWEFNILLEKVDNNFELDESSAKLLEMKGKAPEQYPDWDEE